MQIDSIMYHSVFMKINGLTANFFFAKRQE